MRVVMHLAAAMALVATALAMSPVASRAECVSQPNRFPDFADVAPTARTVVIGTVVETRPYPDEDSVVFSLRVDDVVRGDPAATMDIEVLRSGLPRRGSDACRASAALHVRVGDVIALALDGRLGARRNVNAAAWIKGGPDEWVPGVRVMTRAAVIAAAQAMPPTDAAPTGSHPDVVDLISVALRSVAAWWDGLMGVARQASPSASPRQTQGDDRRQVAFDVVRRYVAALRAGEYETAWNHIGPETQRFFSSFDSFVDQKGVRMGAAEGDVVMRTPVFGSPDLDDYRAAFADVALDWDRATLVELFYPRMPLTPGDWELYLVAPDAHGDWRMWDAR